MSRVTEIAGLGAAQATAAAMVTLHTELAKRLDGNSHDTAMEPGKAGTQSLLG
jgi:hypothetical protein